MEESVRRKDRLAAVGRVAAGLAHEIRNPLGAMRGRSRCSNQAQSPESTQASLMDIILKESDRLNSIITNFLNYARPAAGEFAETDVAETIRDTLTLLKHSPDVREDHVLNARSCQSTPDIDLGGRGAAKADILEPRSQCHTSDARRRRACVSGWKQYRTIAFAITFSDTGQGMSQDQVEQLFEPFSNSTSGGTGLGLSIVYQIVKDHNGVINVRSREGQGTTITVDLPREHRRARPEAEVSIHDSAEPSKLKDFLKVGEKMEKLSS